MAHSTTDTSTDTLTVQAGNLNFSLRGSLTTTTRLRMIAERDRIIAEINRRTGLNTTTADYR